MRRIRSIFYAVTATAVVASGFATPAIAGRLDDCHKPPPAWYTAPLRTHTYSQQWGAGYASASTHDYSAQRRSYRSEPRHFPPQRRYYTTKSHRW